MKKRNKLYKNACDFSVRTDGKTPEMVARIIEKWLKQSRS